MARCYLCICNRINAVYLKNFRVVTTARRRNRFAPAAAGQNTEFDSVAYSVPCAISVQHSFNLFSCRDVFTDGACSASRIGCAPGAPDSISRESVRARLCKINATLAPRLSIVDNALLFRYATDN